MMRRRSDTLKANLCQAHQRNLKTIAPLSHRPIVTTIGLSVFSTIILILIISIVTITIIMLC